MIFLRSICITLLFFLPVSTSAQLVINEVCPSNKNDFDFPTEGHADWVEILYLGGPTVFLEDYYLTDNSDDLQKWNFPDLSMNTGEILLFPARRYTTNDTTVSFNFSRKTEFLILSDGVTILDSIYWEEVWTDHSIGRDGANHHFFDVPTPGAVNTSTAYKGYADRPEFDTESGYYTDPMTVGLTADPSHNIFYQIDGHINEPDISYSAPFDISTTTTITAYCTADSMLNSRRCYRSFLFEPKYTLPIIHIQVDTLAMFDDSTGIYMLGYDSEPDYPYYNANYWKDTTLPAFVEYFDEHQAKWLGMECDLKIHGGTVSRTRAMKSLRFIARKSYEKDNFNYPFFPHKNIEEFNRLLLRNSGSDFNKTHLLDGFLHDFISYHQIDVDIQSYRPVIVYINGHYWGIHNLREKFDRMYLANNYDVNPDSVNLLEEDELWIIEGDSVEFETLGNFIADEDMSIQANYDLAATQLDIHSFVDYFIMQLFVNNRDWPYNNLKLWNAPTHPQYRYMYTDLDAACRYYGTDPLDYNFLESILGSWGDNNIHCRILQNLMDNAEFKRYFVNRYADLMNTVLEREYMLNFIASKKAVIEPAMKRHFYKWWGYVDEWEDNFQKYDDFFEDRVDIVRTELSTVFSFDPSEEIYFGIYPANSGTIKCNTVYFNEFPFKGHYYSTNSIDLTAISNEGGSFLYWENLRTGNVYGSVELTIDPQPGDSLIAVFAEKDETFNLELSPTLTTSTTTLSYHLSESGPLTIYIYDLSGQLVYGLDYEHIAYGWHTVELDASDFKAGEYIVSVRSNQGKDGIKFIKQY